MEIIMELILINKNKLKIMLDESDMKKYHIGNESDYREKDTRKAIRDLLDSAREQIGFDTDGEEVFVQLYASKKGGCELFVTKCQSHGDSYCLAESNQPEPEQKSALPIKSRASLPVAKEKRSVRLAYSFSSLPFLLKVCKILKEKGRFEESQAYSDGGGGFFLFIDSVGLSAYTRLDHLTFITEYGNREDPDRLLSYISEHGKTICSERAVEILGQF